MNKENFIEELKSYVTITFGVVLVAIALVYFYAPNNLAAGGLSGVALIVNHLIPGITIGGMLFVGNSILYVIAFLIIGPEFGFKTIYASFGLSAIIWFMEKFFKPQAITNDLMLASIFGTILVVIGMSIVFNANASTGGTDIIAKILNKYTTFNIGISLLMVDFLVTLLAGLIFGLDTGFYALLCVLGNGPMIDKLIGIFNAKKQITVVSDKNNEISNYIKNTLERGCTQLKASNMVDGTGKDVIYTVLEKKEIGKLKEFIKVIDKDAFLTVAHIEEVTGKGFPIIEF
ncbi:YitT family protein [Clostridium gasigenes]|uniref:YitT family protein n=1 Tax=Clostridium gasigenes TaxID=94869 RepID=UPI001C0B87CC|nr:YitT family protein [Clostridium gasigenes]MBU3104269.1 YitT family protein [Clostridium gasigenes]